MNDDKKAKPVDLMTIPRSELALQELESKTFRAISHWRWVLERKGGEA